MSIPPNEQGHANLIQQLEHVLPSESLFDILGTEEPAGKNTVPVSNRRPPAISNSLLVASNTPTGARKADLPSLSAFLSRQFPYLSPGRPDAKYRPMQIDDRRSNDCAHDFCDISIAVPLPEDGTFLLEMTNPPCDEQDKALVARKSSKWFLGVGHPKVFIALTLMDNRFIRELANAIKRVASVRHVRRTGNRYELPNWRWLAGRTAQSLVKLADALWDYRKLRAAAER
jgi:hypothetical protein